MQKEKKTKTYQIQGKTYEFNSDRFAVLCNERSKLCHQKKTSVEFLLQLEEDLDYDATSSTIKGWMYGINSPATIEMIEKLAKVFRIETMSLLTEKERINAMNKTVENIIDERTREVVDGLYKRFVDAIEKYRYTEGFTDPFWKQVEEEEYFVWAVESEDLVTDIRKSRVFIKADVVLSLMALCGKIFASFEYMGPSIFAIKEVDIKGEETDSLTEYGQYLEGKEDNGSMRIAYVSTQVEDFYRRLEEILVDYLP